MVFHFQNDPEAAGTERLWRLEKDGSLATLWVRRTATRVEMCLEVDGRRQFTMTASLEDVGLQSLRLRNRLQAVGWREAGQTR